MYFFLAVLLMAIGCLLLLFARKLARGGKALAVCIRLAGIALFVIGAVGLYLLGSEKLVLPLADWGVPA